MLDVRDVDDGWDVGVAFEVVCDDVVFCEDDVDDVVFWDFVDCELAVVVDFRVEVVVSVVVNEDDDDDDTDVDAVVGKVDNEVVDERNGGPYDEQTVKGSVEVSDGTGLSSTVSAMPEIPYKIFVKQTIFVTSN